MSAPAEMIAPLIPAGTGRHVVIAHAAGNSLRLTKQAVVDGADFVEVDLYVHGSRFEARHERAVYPIPLWVEKWYLRIAPRRPVGLAELIAEVGSASTLFLDLKNGSGRVAPLIRAALDAAPPGTRLAASSQYWHILRQVAASAPEVELFYSIDVTAKLDLFTSIAEREPAARGVSCRHTLLTRRHVQRLHDRGLAVIAWTVDDEDRARELLEWGVDGITTHNVATVAALRTE
ncbi:MAG TPA: glycerophosphodiester phosphodiesterase [Tepidiformaceae bacterium]|nr:glycerophosphodiester phosphodiesterase [Tepidiformaceae bacterium]